MTEKTSKETPAGSPNTSDPERKPTSKPVPEVHAVVPPHSAADKAEMRAGPGDAGASHAPTQLPPNAEEKRSYDGVSRVVLLIGIAVPVILILIAIF